MEDKEPGSGVGADRRRFRRVPVGVSGRLFVPAPSQEIDCTIADLSAGGAAIICENALEVGTNVVLYAEGFGRFDASVVRANGSTCGLHFNCTAAKRERTAQQLVDFLNNTLVPGGVLRRHRRESYHGLAKFTRADGTIQECKLSDISLGGVSLKTDAKPPVGEFVLIARIAGRVARHHFDGIGIEFVGRENATRSASDEFCSDMRL